MEREKADRLISENMKTIFGFAVSRIWDRHEAEALASDIIYRLLVSAPKLRDDSKFYAYMWKISENAYVDYLRAKKKKNRVEDLSEPVDDGSPTVQDLILYREEIDILHRELALLSEQYRRSTIMYYIENLTCSQIAEKLRISVEMVKYYLFRARKIIREGMDLNRATGEKSYNPVKFEIDFWGTKAGDDAEYRSFRERRIRGNILLSAYYSSISLQELSIELGVSAPYLEDEIRLLEKRQYLISKNGKYLANIPIFTKEFDSERFKNTAPLIKEAANKLTASFDTAFGDVFGNRFENENLLRWQAVTLYCHFSMLRTDSEIAQKYGEWSETGPYSLVNGGGGRGFVWGRCSSENDDTEHDFEGIYNGCPAHDRRGSVIAFNFKQILNGQRYQTDMLDPISCAGVGCFEYLPEEYKKHLNKLGYVKNSKPNFTVYTDDEYARLPKVLKNGIDIFTDLNRQNFMTAAKIIAEHAPEHIRKTAEHSGAFIYQFNGIGNIIAELYDSGWLKPVNDTDKPAMCVIKHIK